MAPLIAQQGTASVQKNDSAMSETASVNFDVCSFVHCTVLLCTALHYTARCCDTLYSTLLHCIVL